MIGLRSNLGPARRDGLSRHRWNSRRLLWDLVQAPGLLLAGFGLALAMAFSASAFETPVKVLLIGDSITEGNISRPGGVDRNCLGGDCYARILVSRLGSDYTVKNAGVGGASTTDWLKGPASYPHIVINGRPQGLFEARALPALPADLVVIMLGVNDALGYFELKPVSPSLYGKNLKQIIRAVHDVGSSLIMLVKPSPAFGRDTLTQSRLANYGSEIDRLCAQLDNVVCGPDLLRLLTPEDFVGDDVHPNIAGHAKIAEALAESIAAISLQ